MKNEGLWHLLEIIFGHLDHKTVELCRKVSHLWDEPLKWISVVKYLQEFGAKIAEHHKKVKKKTRKTRKKRRDIILTIISGWNEAVKKYVRKASIEDLYELKDSLGQLLFERGESHFDLVGRAVESENEKLKEVFTSYVMNLEGVEGMKTFHWACYLGNKETVKMILESSQENEAIDLNARDDRGMTAFHMACACYRDNPETTKLFLDFSKENEAIELNSRNDERWTPFNSACLERNIEIVKLILDFSKETEAIDLNSIKHEGSGWTPLSLVGEKAILEGNKEIVELVNPVIIKLMLDDRSM